ncbi:MULTISPECIES: hypothetical protein [unclassified Neochlamydia]|uniref:hypothetical protein n=1 Tax=unclassified Neochlamydia TaxID=2643326 RepID=UPI00140E2AF5|nr:MULTISPECIES: hypothetical protein [unclassified Neochlamydia]MBS4166889.1 hypothetical protein [Neochlamydia sp. AcF65]MBS4170594.1 hypothetical protein [Neochlamydia sp. AcF95]NGY94615.1 hypothetical protein [Neochlamydia sp. AcF84]
MINERRDKKIGHSLFRMQKIALSNCYLKCLDGLPAFSLPIIGAGPAIREDLTL